jgi:hypothetical protein
LEERCLISGNITLAPSEPAPQLVGEPITWTATVAAAPPGLVYKFDVITQIARALLINLRALGRSCSRRCGSFGPAFCGWYDRTAEFHSAEIVERPVERME